MLSYDFVLGAHIAPLTSRSYSPPLFGLGPPLPMGGEGKRGERRVDFMTSYFRCQDMGGGGPIVLT